MTATDNLTPFVIDSSFDVDTRSIEVRLSEAIAPGTLTPSSIQVTNTTSGETFISTNLTFNANHVLHVALPSLGDGNYSFKLPARSLEDAAGNTSSSAITLAAGQSFVLAGDADHDRDVDFNDLLRLAKNYGQSGKTFSQGDFNYDGVVDFNDLLILAKSYNATLSAAAAATATELPAPVARHRVAEELLS